MKKVITLSLVALLSVMNISVVQAIGSHNDDFSEQAIGERIAPVGFIALAQAAKVKRTTPRTGDELYQEVCASCHGTGLLGAPISQTADWTPRKAKGFAVLLKHALEGFNAMPAKGGCSDCSDMEIESAIKYMTGE